MLRVGPGFTWSENSHDNRLTPWRNDPVVDPPGRGRVHPRRGQSTSLVGDCLAGGRRSGLYRPPRLRLHHIRARPSRHRSELTLLVAPDAPVKLFRLALRNTSGRARRLSVTLYVDWVLGEQRATDAASTSSPRRAGNRRCRWRRTPSVTSSPSASRSSICQSRPSGGSPGIAPSSSGATVACAAGGDGAADAVRPRRGRRSIRAAPSRSRSTLGPARERDRRPARAKARTATRRAPRSSAIVPRARRTRRSSGARVLEPSSLGAVRCRRPTRRSTCCSIAGCSTRRSLPHLGPLGASTSRAARSASAISCRMSWRLLLRAPDLRASTSAARGVAPVRRGRRAALVAQPAARACARGSPTICSGCRMRRRHYVTATGDDAVLDELVPFLEGAARTPTSTRSTSCRRVSRETATLYEHCVRASTRSLPLGAHGLPLMGTGDWNDGMNRVGAEGQGESVWLGWFLLTRSCDPFADIAEARGDAIARRRYRAHAARRCRGARTRLGRRMVSPRVLRRRHAAGIGAETTSAGSTRSRSRGRCISGAAPIPRGARGDGLRRRAPGSARQTA